MRPLLLAFAGFTLAFAGLASLPATAFAAAWIRDSGIVTLVLGALGGALAVWGLVGAWRRRGDPSPRLPSWKVRVGATLVAAVTLALSALQIAYITVLSYHLPPPEAVAAVGADLPDITLDDSHGKPFVLRSLGARGIVLHSYRGFW